MTFDAFIVIMLTAIGILVALLGLMLTALAIGIGVAALWGYNGMVEAAAKAGEKAASKVSLEKVIEKAVSSAKKAAQDTIIANKDKWMEQMALGVELSAAQSEVPRSTSNESVGEPYPQGEAGNGDSDSVGDQDNAGADHPATSDETAS